MVLVGLVDGVEEEEGARHQAGGLVHQGCHNHLQFKQISSVFTSVYPRNDFTLQLEVIK